MSEQGKGSAGQQKLGREEADALREAIREVREAQQAVQLATVNEKLNRISHLLGVVQV